MISPITETSTCTMWTKCCHSKSFPILLCIKPPPYCGNLPSPNYGHRSHIPMDKINTRSPLKEGRLDLLDSGIDICCFRRLYSCFYPFFNCYISRPLCTQGALVHAKIFELWHMRQLERVVTLPGALSPSYCRNFRLVP